MARHVANPSLIADFSAHPPSTGRSSCDQVPTRTDLSASLEGLPAEGGLLCLAAWSDPNESSTF